MNDYIRNAFKSLEDLQVVIEPVKTTLKEAIEDEAPKGSMSLKELLESESSYIVTYDFEDDGLSYSLFIEALHDGESCDILFEEFDINNVTEVLVEVLDSEHEFLGSLTGEDITLETTTDEAISKARSAILGSEELSSESEEEEANEREFINGDPEEKPDELPPAELDAEVKVEEESLNESKMFNLQDAKEVDEAEATLKKKGKDTIEQIVDVSAESESDLKKSYIGSTILQCPTCLSMIYKNPDQVVPSEDDPEIFNIDEVCPHCGAKDGFTRVGTVASLDVDPFAEPEPPMVEPAAEPAPEVEAEEEEAVDLVPAEDEEEVTLKKEDLDSEEELEASDDKEDKEGEEELEDEEDKSEGDSDEEKKEGEEEEQPLNEEVPVEEYTADEIFDAVDSSLKHSGDSVAIQLKDRVFVCDLDDVPEGGVPEDGNFEFTGCEVLSKDIGKLDDGTPYMEDCEPEKHYVVKDGVVEEKVEEECEGEECKEEGKEEKESGEPEEEKKEEECEGGACKTGEVKLESFDEERFDKLVTKYLKETYSNVSSYKTVTAGLHNPSNRIIMEGVITFKSGKEKPTKFTFEAKEINHKGQLKLVGLNEMFSKGRAYTLVGTLKDTKLLSESLAYRYEVNGTKIKGKAESFRKR